MNRLHIDLVGFIKLSGMLLAGLLFMIGLMVVNKKDYDVTDPIHYIPTDIEAEKLKYKQLEKDVAKAKEIYAYNLAHPTIIPQTPPRKYTYGGWVNLDNTPMQKNKFGMVIKDKPKVSNPAPMVNPVSPVQKKTQKMVRYEDWVDEVDELQYPKQPEAPIMKEDN